jgi:hypothetical protein
MGDIWPERAAPASIESVDVEVVGPIKRLREDGSENASP